MQLGRAVGKIFSNEAVENIPVFKHLATHGPDGVGMKNALNVTKNSGRKMGKYDKMSKDVNTRIAQLQKDKTAALKADGLDDARKAEIALGFDNQIKSQQRRLDTLTERSGVNQDNMMDGAGDALKSVGRYFGATDLRGQSGRAMAVGVRGAVGVGAYMGANTAMRYVSGGGMTYNNQGERDIAGIPFI